MLFRRVLRIALVGFVLGFLTRSLRAQSAVPEEGFRAVDLLSLPEAAFPGGLAYSPEEHPITYDSVSGEILLHAGGPPLSLARFDPPVFGSFLVLHPDGEAVIFAESSASNVYSVPLTGAGADMPIDNITFAYDLVFDSDGHGLVSTPDPVTANRNRIVLLDSDPSAANQDVVTGIPGASGPLTLDPDGNLYYITADFTTPGMQSFHRIAAAVIQGAIAGEPVDFDDVSVQLLHELDGAFSLRWLGGKLLFTDLGFVSGTRGLFLIDPDANFAISTLATFELPPSYIAVRPGTTDLAAGAGPEAGSILVAFGNGAAVGGVVEIAAETWFVRGELNGDGLVDISDAITLLLQLFVDRNIPIDVIAADINQDDGIDTSDAIYLLDFLFRGGPPIPAPFPEPGPES